MGTSGASRSGRCWGRLALVGFRGREAAYGHDFTTNLLHVDAEAICPRCLSWIAPSDIVRRTAYGPVQHEACPITVDEPDTAHAL